MRVSDQTIESILKQGGVVDEPQLADLKLIAERSKQTLQETAIEQKSHFRGRFDKVDRRLYRCAFRAN